MQDPVVSRMLLNFSLKVLRIRTGLRVESNDWSVSPFRFAVSFKKVKLSLESQNIAAEEVQFQFSPLYLMLGDLHLKGLYVEDVDLLGRVGINWDDKDDTKNDPELIPGKIANFVIKANEILKKRNISYEELELKNARILASDLKANIESFYIQNLERGQLRIQGVVNDIDFPKRIGSIKRVEASALILSEGIDKYYLAIRKINVDLDEESFVRTSGRWPGDIKVQVEGPVENFDSWLLHTPQIKDWNTQLKPSGHLKLEATYHSQGSDKKNLYANLKLRDFKIDGYHPNNVDGDIVWENDSVLLKHFKIELPRTNWEPNSIKNTILLDGTRIAGGKISGQLKAEDAGLCGILRASSVEECYVKLQVNGVLDFQGPLENFEIIGQSHLNLSAFDVYSDPKMYKLEAASKVLRGNPVKLEGQVRILAKDLFLENMKLVWNENVEIPLTGKVIYNPTILDIQATPKDTDLSEVLENFVGIKIAGRLSAQADIHYDYSQEPKKRTLVNADLGINGMSVLEQDLGKLTGLLKYENKILHMGPLRLDQGGGKAHILGQLYSRPGVGGWMKLDTLFDQYEWQFKLDPETIPVHGFWSGSLEMNGALDMRSPQRLKGPMMLTGRNLKSFGLAFNSARLIAETYVNKLLIKEMLVFKEEGSFSMSGDLNPDKSQLHFELHPIKIKSLNLIPSVEKIFDYGFASGSGNWSTFGGWDFNASLSQLKIDKLSLAPIQVSAKGNGKDLQFQMKSSKHEGLFQSEKKGDEWQLKKVHLKAEEEGLSILFAMINDSQRNDELISRGLITYDWSESGGQISTDNLGLTLKSDRLERPLVWLAGKQNLSWNNYEATGELRSQNGSLFVLDSKNCSHCIRVNGDLNSNLVDTFVPDLLRFHAGSFKINGNLSLPLNDRSLNLNAEMEKVGFSIKNVGQPVENARGLIKMNGEKLEISQAEGSMGSGRAEFQGTYRWLSKDRGIYLNFQLQKAQVALLSEFPMTLDGNLLLAGPKLPYTLKGNLAVSNGLYAKEFSGGGMTYGIGQVQSPSLIFDIKAEVNNTFLVKNSLASTQVFGSLLISGSDVNPLFVGNLNIDKGFLYARDQTFSISRGTANFQRSLVPNMALQASTNIRYNNGDYRIDLLASGSASDLKLDFKSEPPLPTQDIISLLAFGFIRSDLERNELSSGTSNEGGGLIQSAGFEAFQAVFGQKIGSNVSKTTGFQVSLGTKINNTAQDPVTKVEVTRKLGKKTTATFGRSLNLSKPENNFQVDYKLYKNMNLTGVWESPEPEAQSMGADIRFKFDLK